MRPKIADYILLELSLTLGLIYVLWPVRSVFAQCSNWMTPSYSEYATSSSDGTYVYTSVIASGTTYGACPGGCGNICPSTTHTIGALSLTPSTSSCTGYGWTYEPPEPWGSWLDWVNNQQVAAAPGTLVGFCSEGAVICSFVGQFWNTPIAYNTAASYTRIQHNYSRNPLPQLCWISSFFDAVRAGHTHHAEDVVYDNGKGTGGVKPSYGTAVYAMEAGMVVAAPGNYGPAPEGYPACNKPTGTHAGNYVKIQASTICTGSSGDGYSTIYFHVKPLPTIAKGVCVAAGQQLGTLDNSGCQSGPHLHVGRKDPNGIPVNFTIPCTNQTPTKWFYDGLVDDYVDDNW